LDERGSFFDDTHSCSFFFLLAVDGRTLDCLRLLRRRFFSSLGTSDSFLVSGTGLSPLVFSSFEILRDTLSETLAVFAREVEENCGKLVLSVEIGEKGSEERVELIFVGVLDELFRRTERSFEGIFENCDGASEARRGIAVVWLVTPFEEDALEFGFVLDNVANSNDGRFGEVLARPEFRVEFLVDGRHGLPESETISRFESEIFGKFRVSKSESGDGVNGSEDGRSRTVFVQGTDSLDGPFGQLRGVSELAKSVESVSATEQRYLLGTTKDDKR
jgi:hypothetical protein